MFECVASASASFELSLTNKELRKAVKGQTGLDVRRMDNFCLVAISALDKLFSQYPKVGKVGLYSSAPYFSVDLVQGLLQGIARGDEMRPVDFISTVGNTANYYMAKLFDLDGPNIFIGTSASAQQKLELLAQCDLVEKTVDYALSIQWNDNEQNSCCDVKLLKLR